MEAGVLGIAIKPHVLDQLENSSKVSMRVLRSDPPGKWEREFVGELLRSMHCKYMDL